MPGRYVIPDTGIGNMPNLKYEMNVGVNITAVFAQAGRGYCAPQRTWRGDKHPAYRSRYDLRLASSDMKEGDNY